MVNRSLESHLKMRLNDDVIAVLEKGVGCAHFTVTPYRNCLKGNTQQLFPSFSH